MPYNVLFTKQSKINPQKVFLFKKKYYLCGVDSCSIEKKHNLLAF